MADIVALAAEFAGRAHGSIDQRRQSGKPYIIHPRAVAEIVREYSSEPAMIAAAWLHDVVEDTPVEMEEIEQLFGSEIATLVEELTDVAAPQDGNRAQRKALDRKHSAQASPKAKTVKLADILANLQDVHELSTRFALQYIQESELLMNVLREGDRDLYHRVQRQLVDIKQRIAKPQ